VDYFADAIRQFYRPGEVTALLEGVGFDNIENRNFLTGVMAYQIARKPPA
jgi:ubiquinone/menaquinone biosynthesis C-methylase UbiE